MQIGWVNYEMASRSHVKGKAAHLVKEDKVGREFKKMSSNTVAFISRMREWVEGEAAGEV